MKIYVIVIILFLSGLAKAQSTCSNYAGMTDESTVMDVLPDGTTDFSLGVMMNATGNTYYDIDSAQGMGCCDDSYTDCLGNTIEPSDQVVVTETLNDLGGSDSGESEDFNYTVDQYMLANCADGNGQIPTDYPTDTTIYQELC